MNTKVVLAIDLGTTGNRVMAFAKDGTVVAKSYYEFPQIFPKPGWVEHNPLQILETTLKALRDVMAVVGADNVVSIGITNQRETTIIWDKKSGQPVYNAIVWQDRRTENVCRQLETYQSLIKEKTGLFLDPYFSATKIKWIIDNVSGVKEKIGKGEIIFGTPESWILWHITAGQSHCTEPSNASRTMLFNINSLEFDRELLGIFGIAESILPTIKDSDSFFGFTDKKFTDRKIPIHGILGDQQASLFAQCGRRDGVVKATYGTGIFVMTNTSKKFARSENLINTVAWKIGGEINYALEGSIFMGGAAIQWLRDNLKILSTLEESEQLAASLPDNEGVYFVPALQGLGSPYWDAQARGLLIGMTRKTSRQAIIRAALEAMAYQVQDVLVEIQKVVAEKFVALKVDGGAAVNDFLMQFQADVSNTAVERTKMTEITALGAAEVSALNTGFWDKKDFQNLVKTDKVFYSTMDKQKAESFYQKWKQAVSRSRDWAGDD